MAAKKTKKPSAEYQFVHAYLKKKPKAEFAEIRDAAAKKKGLKKIAPILYGLVQNHLGLVKAKPRKTKKRTKKAAAAKGVKRTGARRGPGRPRKTASVADASLAELIAGVRDVERERNELRDALRKIRDVIDRVVD